jgi:hypothetical protein
MAAALCGEPKYLRATRAASDTLEGMLKGLEAPSGALVVMDRGIATEENLQWLRESGYRYLVVSRERIRQFEPSQARALETAAGQTVHLQKVPSEDGREVRLYCHSAERAKKEEGISGRFVERFEAGLQKLADGLAKPRGEKRIAKLWERIGRLKQSSHGIAQHYRIEIMAAEDGQSAAQLIWERVPVQGTALTHPGVYCLRSSETDWGRGAAMAHLHDAHRAFRRCSARSSRSWACVRSITKPKSAPRATFSSARLSYQFVQVIRRRLKEHGITERWRTLRERLAGQCRVTAMLRRADGRTLHVRKTTRAEPVQLAIYQALGVNPAPGGIKKMTI